MDEATADRPAYGDNAVPVVTLTVNPALDVSTSAEQVVSEHKIRCGPTQLDPGGGGVNVARVVHRLGGRAVAIYTAGGVTGAAHTRLLKTEGVERVVVPIVGDTRESFTVDETATGRQYRFVLQGPRLREAEWQACLTALEQTVEAGAIVVASGSLPPGVPDAFYARVARVARERGARCVVDTSGPALAEALAEGVYLIKPSLRELRELVGADLDSEQAQVDAASALIARGSTELVALTLGARGAVLASGSGITRLPVPEVEVQSTVGAGDSFLAAFVLRLSQGRELDTALRSAVAAGSATAMTPATDLCRPDDVAALEEQLTAR